MTKLTVEQAFRKLMDTKSGRELAYLCYYDEEVVAACERFSASDEWRVVSVQIASLRQAGRRALDLGAGNGIASYALASLGYSVVAVEPDPSSLVGYGALRKMIKTTGLPIVHIAAYGEALPLPSRYFDVVYTRQVLHHAQNLPLMLAEIKRMLVPGGLHLAAREHVVDDEVSLNAFLSEHPIHPLTGGESGFTLDEYLHAIRTTGLSLRQMWGPWDSAINTYPMAESDIRANIRNRAPYRLGRLWAILTGVPAWRRMRLKVMSAEDRRPGRLYSFLSESGQDA